MNQREALQRLHPTITVNSFFMCAQNTVKLAFLAVLLVSGPLYASTRATCSKLFYDRGEIAQEKIFGTLPRRNSAIYSKLVQDLKSQIQMTGAYAILDLRSFISELSGLLWANSFPKGVGSQIHQDNILYSRDGKSFREEPKQWQIEGIAKLQKWLRELILDAVPGAQLKEGFTNVRNSTEDGLGQIFDEWHIDGGQASVTLAVQGVGTEVLGGAPLNLPVWQYHEIRGTEWEAHCPNCKSMTVPAGYALVFFGSGSGASGLFSPTIHRTPKEAGARTLFVIRY